MTSDYFTVHFCDICGNGPAGFVIESTKGAYKITKDAHVSNQMMALCEKCSMTMAAAIEEAFSDADDRPTPDQKRAIAEVNLLKQTKERYR